MDYTLEDKYNMIKTEVVKHKEINPLLIANSLMKLECINMHGPEHHFLDGASFLVAYNNACNKLDINASLNELANRTIKMPGAMCGYWGVCGSVTAIGACLSIINNTTPISKTAYYKDNMEFTSRVITIMSKIGGPRCCKRNAFISLTEAVKFVNEKYNVNMEYSKIVCTYSSINKQCIGNNCPFNK